MRATVFGVKSAYVVKTDFRHWMVTGAGGYAEISREETGS